MNNSKGKQSLPYLLSTTKTLARCKRYYYDYFDFKFSSKRNRDCYTERNVRINITRMWHNIILPNAIISRENDCPSTIKDAMDALNYAMTHGKTKRSLEAWHHVCEEEAKLSGSSDPDMVAKSIGFKFKRSFYYYAMGMGATKDGLLYNLPKNKAYTVATYMLDKNIFRFMIRTAKVWVCPWEDLNDLVYRFKHYNDEYNNKCKELSDLIKHKEFERVFLSGEDRDKLEKEIEALNKALDDIEEPTFPKTQRAIVEEFHVSMTSAARFILWRKQLRKAKNLWDPDDVEEVSWPLPKWVKSEAENDFIDTDKPNENDDDGQDDISPATDESVDKAIQSAINSGERPSGRWDEEEENLPF